MSDPPFTSRHQKDAARKREARHNAGGGGALLNGKWIVKIHYPSLSLIETIYVYIYIVYIICTYIYICIYVYIYM